MYLNIKDRLKQNKGFTAIDLSIAVVIIIVFVSLIAILFFNSQVSSNNVKRNTLANKYVTDVLSAIDYIDYNSVENSNNFLNKISEYMQDKIVNNNLSIKINDYSIETTKPYNMNIIVENYNEKIGNQNKEDFVKEITVIIKYKKGSNGEYEDITVRRIKAREKGFKDELGIVPKISSDMVPVKYIYINNETGEGYWQVTTENDPEWFDYSSKKWANAMLKDSLISDNTGRVSVVRKYVCMDPKV